jgi:hypothetical protein
MEINCPRCQYYADYYQAPKGKVIRTHAAGGREDDCSACEGKGVIPPQVIKSIERFARTPERAQEILSQLRWSGDHFSFMAGNMYVGVEVDGYLHT